VVLPPVVSLIHVRCVPSESAIRVGFVRVFPLPQKTMMVLPARGEKLLLASEVTLTPFALCAAPGVLASMASVGTPHGLLVFEWIVRSRPAGECCCFSSRPRECRSRWSAAFRPSHPSLGLSHACLEVAVRPVFRVGLGRAPRCDQCKRVVVPRAAHTRWRTP
jgi:hypothetical protein